MPTEKMTPSQRGWVIASLGLVAAILVFVGVKSVVGWVAVTADEAREQARINRVLGR